MMGAKRAIRKNEDMDRIYVNRVPKIEIPKLLSENKKATFGYE
jgi:hypothetical protein